MATCTSHLMFVAVFLLGYISSGLSLKCYKCNSEFNGACDTINPARGEVENCEESKLKKAFPDVGNKYVCVMHRMAQPESPQYSIVRGCAPDQYCAIKAFNASKECHTCESDLCNSSSIIVPSTVLISIIGFVCAKFYF